MVDSTQSDWSNQLQVQSMTAHPGRLCEDVHSSIPPWWEGEIPTESLYSEEVLMLAGLISTMPPFDHYHPAYALPLAVAIVAERENQRKERR